MDLTSHEYQTRQARAAVFRALWTYSRKKIRIWMRTWSTRRHLMDLDEKLYDDIGVTYEEAMKEAMKPFWIISADDEPSAGSTNNQSRKANANRQKQRLI